jgi:hypothetical protein
MRRGHLVLCAVQAVLLVFGVLAASAIACEGAGEEGPTSTTLSTKLSGESKEGEEITVLEGAKVKDKATLSGKNASKATGKVTYNVYSEKECKTLVKAAGEVTVSGESVPASSEEELEAGKTYYWQAHYGGDSKNKESTSSCTEILNVKAKTTLATSLKDEEHSGETLEATEEQSVSDQATLSGTNSAKASGTVKYAVYSDKECKKLVTEAGEVTVTSGSVPVSGEVPLIAGTYYWQATYSGDSLHSGSTSTCGSEVLTVKASTSLKTTLSGEGQSSNEVEVVEGTAITDQASLGGSNSANAGGKVKYAVYSEEECKTLVAEAGEVTVTKGSVPASSEEKLKAGTYYWQATYSGDSGDAASTSPCGGEVSIVNASTTLSTSLSGGGQEGGTISVSEGTKVTDYATLSGANKSKAMGSVDYYVYSDSECKTLVAEAGEVTVTGGVVPTSNEKLLAPGTYYWRAFYSGDGLNHASASTCSSEVATVKATTALGTTLTGGGKTRDTISVAEGTGITDQATLSGTGASTATGTVKYSVYSEKECKTLVTGAGEVTVTKGSIPVSTEEKLKAGTYYWQATYSGDSANESSTSACGGELSVVRKTLLTTSLSGEGQSGEQIQVVNGAVHDTSTLSGEGASTATGTVKYDVYSDSACTKLAAEAGEVEVKAGVVPNSKEETLAEGTYYWQATYSGDSKHEGSTAPCDEEIEVVGPAPPKVEQVEFTNDQPVIVDHKTETWPENAEAIEEYTGKDGDQWEYSPTKAELVKSWPVAYAKEATPDAKARFDLPTATKKLILEKKLEGKPTISGSMTLEGKTITFTKEFASATELEEEVKKHESYIELGESSAVVANSALPAEVRYAQTTIEWKWTIKIAGTATNTTQSLGSSTYNLFVMPGEPSTKACKTVAEAESAGNESAEEKVAACVPIYFTILQETIESLEQQPQPLSEAKVIASVWKIFSKQGKEAILPPALQMSRRPIRVPYAAPVLYNAERGAWQPAVLWYKYYEPVRPGASAAVFVLPRLGCSTFPETLMSGTGRCGAWAQGLTAALLAMAVPTAQTLHMVVNLTPALAGNPAKCTTAEAQPFRCSMLIKNWKWLRSLKVGNFPEAANDILDVNGAPGQGNENPPPFFWDHAIVKAGNANNGNRNEKSSALYDPSYGTGPFPANLKEIEEGRVAQPTQAEVLKKYQEASISGYCEGALNLNSLTYQQPVKCRLAAGEPAMLAPVRLNMTRTGYEALPAGWWP